MAQQQIQKLAGFGPGPVGLAEPGLMGEGIGLQPVQKLGAITGHHRQLRHMHMGVDKARHNQALGPVPDIGSAGQA